MGTITARRGKRGATYRAAVCVDGVRQSKSFKAKAEARAWMQEAETGLAGQSLPEHTVKNALVRYAREVAPGHKGARWEVLRLAAIEKQPIAALRLPALKGSDMADWRDYRLRSVSPSTVLREINLLHSVFESCRCDWGWLTANPFTDVIRPTAPRSRKRRISQDEVTALCEAMGYEGGKPATATQRIAVAFLFALETAMRSGEIVGLHWSDVGPDAVSLPETKNGDAREVALSKEARRLLSLMPEGDGPIFGLTDSQRDALYRKARGKGELRSINFHDSRGEAVWRLSKKLDVMELARMIGHRDLNSLLHYYRATAAELSAKLG